MIGGRACKVKHDNKYTYYLVQLMYQIALYQFRTKKLKPQSFYCSREFFNFKQV